MALTYLGSLTLAAALPGAAAGFAAGIDGISLALPDIQARLDALLAFSPQPISFTANVALAQQIVASLQLVISLGISPPDISAQIAIIASLVASLYATISLINARLSIVIDLSALLDAAGVFAYSYAGAADGLGPALTAELSAGFPGGTGGAQAANAIVLATTTPATWTAMQGVFAT